MKSETITLDKALSSIQPMYYLGSLELPGNYSWDIGLLSDDLDNRAKVFSKQQKEMVEKLKGKILPNNDIDIPDINDMRKYEEWRDDIIKEGKVTMEFEEKIPLSLLLKKEVPGNVLKFLRWYIENDVKRGVKEEKAEEEKPDKEN